MGPKAGFKAGIGASELEFSPQSKGFTILGLGLNTGFSASRPEFGPQNKNLGLKAKTWTLRLGFEPQSFDFGLKVRIGLKARIWASRLELRPQS